MTEKDKTPPPEALLPLEAGNHVINLNRLIAPDAGRIAAELASPAPVEVDRGDGYMTYVDSDHSLRDEVTAGMAGAAERVGRGLVGEFRILSGFVSGDYGFGNNARDAFTELNRLNPVLGTDFHTLFKDFDARQADVELPFIKDSAEQDGPEWQQAMSVAVEKARKGNGIVRISELDGTTRSRLIALKNPDGTHSETAFLKVTTVGSEGNAYASMVLTPKELKSVSEVKKDEVEHTPENDTITPEFIRTMVAGMALASRIGGERVGGTYKDTTLIDGLAERELPDGKKEALTHMFFMGKSVFGVKRTIDADNNVTEASVAILPIGINSGLDQPITLISIDPVTAETPREDGRVQHWEQTPVGREMIRELTGMDDRTMSGEHATVSITNGGSRVELGDVHSLNGSKFMTIDTLSKPNMFANESAREAAIALRDSLVEHTELWAGK